MRTANKTFYIPNKNDPMTMLDQCWASIVDYAPILIQHWTNEFTEEGYTNSPIIVFVVNFIVCFYILKLYTVCILL